MRPDSKKIQKYRSHVLGAGHTQLFIRIPYSIAFVCRNPDITLAWLLKDKTILNPGKSKQKFPDFFRNEFSHILVFSFFEICIDFLRLKKFSGTRL